MYLMLDLETLGTSEYSPVISIGAVIFDQNGIKDKFYVNLDISEQINAGLRKVDAGTLKWWLGQSDAAKKVFKENFESVSTGLVKLKEFINDNCNFSEIKPFGNGATFDITIIETLFKQYDIEIPWEFWNIRDLRTFKEFVYDGNETKRQGTHHNALDDSIFQEQIVIDGLNKRVHCCSYEEKLGKS